MEEVQKYYLFLRNQSFITKIAPHTARGEQQGLSRFTPELRLHFSTWNSLQAIRDGLVYRGSSDCQLNVFREFSEDKGYLQAPTTQACGSSYDAALLQRIDGWPL